MKVKQKKLQAENFGHITKEEIASTKKLLERIYMVDGDIADIQNGIHVIFHLATCDGAKVKFNLSNAGWAFIRIKESIATAYVILVKRNLTPENKLRCGNRLALFKEDNFLYVPDIPVNQFLQVFFGFKTIGEWGELLDVLISAVVSEASMNETIYQKDIIQSRFLLTKLPLVLQEVGQNRGIENSIS